MITESGLARRGVRNFPTHLAPLCPSPPHDRKLLLFIPTYTHRCIMFLVYIFVKSIRIRSGPCTATHTRERQPFTPSAICLNGTVCASATPLTCRTINNLTGFQHTIFFPVIAHSRTPGSRVDQRTTCSG